MMLKIKQIGMLLVTMSAMLVLFAGCGDKDDGGDKESLATLVAETVSSSTTTNKISTQGPSGITFEATIVSQGGDAEWCSFDLNKQVSSAGGNVGDPAYLYLDKNNSDDDRTDRRNLYQRLFHLPDADAEGRGLHRLRPFVGRTARISFRRRLYL